MKTVCSPNRCTGCMACIEACPKYAISIRDSLEAYNAEIDEVKCIHCDACVRVCQQNQKVALTKPILWKQGWAERRSDYQNSSSGGLGAALIRSFLKSGGIVYACRFQNGRFGFDMVSSEADIPLYIGSKYVKSDPSGIYRKLRSILKEGKKVLFIGLPCQVAAVKLFCGEALCTQLYTVDLICHGTPSPKLLETYLGEWGIPLKTLQSVQFRKKTTFGLYPDQEKLSYNRVMDLYTRAFLDGLDYTENCYTCRFARLERCSDLTIGDSWGSDLQEEDQQQGLSLLLCQTEKGMELLADMELHLADVDLEKAMQANTQLREPTKKPEQRKRFFMRLIQTGSCRYAAASCMPWKSLKQSVKCVLIRAGLMQDWA